MPEIEGLLQTTRWLLAAVLAILGALVAAIAFHASLSPGLLYAGGPGTDTVQRTAEEEKLWKPPAWSEISGAKDEQLIRYGRELIEHTAVYLGPNGKVARISNGMNCQNCHLQAGTKTFAANYSAVASGYPKFRARSGSIEGFEKRVNDCIERSLNGTALPAASEEMVAIVSYLKWVGKDVEKGVRPRGVGLVSLPLLKRAADTLKGKPLYGQFCSSCHGLDGAGMMPQGAMEWTYPPLWGDNSYNTGAGLYRISTFAAFIKANMPYGASHENPVLSDEQAWDIAAYVNSQPRPRRDFPADWPDLAAKPIDHPFGPYADDYTEAEHKYGPYHRMTPVAGVP